jgi:hypothetical protein
MTRRTLTAVGTFALSICSLGLAPVEKAAPAPAEKVAPARAPAVKAAVPAKAVAEPPPSADEIRKALDDGEPRDALQKVGKALALKGPAAGQYDRHELWRLKAEAHLRLKDVSAASTAFAAAAKEAGNDAARAEDKASEIVIKRSKNLTFTPKVSKKGAKAEPIDISDPEKRKDAFAALLEEEKAEAAPKLKAARGAKTLPPIVDALKVIADLRMLELAATGADAAADETTQALSDQAHKLMDDAVQDMAALVKDVDASANELVPIAVPGRGAGGRTATLEPSVRRRGLSTPDMQDLKRTIADLKKLVPMARELAEALGDAGKGFEKVAEDGAAVGNRAHELLTTDYGNDTSMLRRETRMKRPVEKR